jgi:phosphatidylinositol 3-kinase
MRRQADLIASLCKICKDLRASKDSRPRKIERLKETIADSKNGLLSFPPMPLSLDAAVQITGLIPGSFYVFFLRDSFDDSSFLNVGCVR